MERLADSADRRVVLVKPTARGNQVINLMNAEFLETLKELNHSSIGLLQKDFFPVIQSIPGLQAGPFGSMLEKVYTNPQGLYNVLLSTETIRSIPENLQQVLLPPLKATLADSLHVVFLVAMCIAILGIVVSLLIGNAKVERAEAKERRKSKGNVSLKEDLLET